MITLACTLFLKNFDNYQYRHNYMDQKLSKKGEQNLQISQRPIRLKLRIPRLLNPLSTYSCGNWAFISQRLINDPEEAVGMAQLLFNHHQLISVQEMPHFLNLKISLCLGNELPIQYGIERLNSLNNDKCMKLSMLIVEIQRLYADFASQIKLLKFSSVSETLKQLGDAKYIIFSGNIAQSGLNFQNVFISKKMLKQMGHDPINFGISCMKMQTIVAEFIGNQIYVDGMIFHLSYILLHLKFALGLQNKYCSHKEVSDCMNIRVFNKINDINYNTLYCYSKYFAPNPNVAVIQILGVEARIPNYKNKRNLISPQAQRLDQMNELRVVNSISGQKKPKIIRSVAVPLQIFLKETSGHKTQMDIQDQIKDQS